MSSKRRARRRECTDKRRFKSPEEAQGALASLRWRGLHGLGMTWYRCRFCGGYHVGRVARAREGRRLKLWEINQGGY